MKIGVLIFDLDDAYSERQHIMASQSEQWVNLVWKLREGLIKFTNDGHEFKTPDEVIQYMIEFINDECIRKSLDPDVVL